MYYEQRYSAPVAVAGEVCYEKGNGVLDDRYGNFADVEQNQRSVFLRNRLSGGFRLACF